MYMCLCVPVCVRARVCVRGCRCGPRGKPSVGAPLQAPPFSAAAEVWTVRSACAWVCVRVLPLATTSPPGSCVAPDGERAGFPWECVGLLYERL